MRGVGSAEAPKLSVKAVIFDLSNELMRIGWLKVTWALGTGGAWLPVGVKAVTAGAVATMANEAV